MDYIFTNQDAYDYLACYGRELPIKLGLGGPSHNEPVVAWERADQERVFTAVLALAQHARYKYERRALRAFLNHLAGDVGPEFYQAHAADLATIPTT